MRIKLFKEIEAQLTHEETLDRVEFAAGLALVLECLDVQNQFLSRSPIRNTLHAWSDPFAIGHTFAGPAFSLFAAISDWLTGLSGNEAERLAGRCKSAASFISLLEDDRNGAHQSFFVVGHVTGGIG